VVHVFEHEQGVFHDFVGGLALDMAKETDSAGVAFEARIIQALRLRVTTYHDRCTVSFWSKMSRMVRIGDYKGLGVAGQLFLDAVLGVERVVSLVL
jgi:hypothetical protein